MVPTIREAGPTGATKHAAARVGERVIPCRPAPADGRAEPWGGWRQGWGMVAATAILGVMLVVIIRHASSALLVATPLSFVPPYAM